MATICKKVCDRCGKQIHYIGWTSKLKKIGILSILNGNPSGYDYSYCDYELCRDICEHYCEYRNTIDSYGECDMQRESGKCPLDRLN